MKMIIASLACFLLCGCQHADPSDCKPPPYFNYYADNRLSPDEQDEFMRGQYEVAAISGWSCGFRDGVNSRKLVIDLP